MTATVSHTAYEVAVNVADWLDRLQKAPKASSRDFQKLTVFQDELQAWGSLPIWLAHLGLAFEQGLLSPQSIGRGIRSVLGRNSAYLDVWVDVASRATPLNWTMENIPEPERITWMHSVARVYLDLSTCGRGEAIAAYFQGHPWAWDIGVSKLAHSKNVQCVPVLSNMLTFHPPSREVLRVALVSLEDHHVHGGGLYVSSRVRGLLCQHYPEWMRQVEESYDAYGLLHGRPFQGIEEFSDCLRFIEQRLGRAFDGWVVELPLVMPCNPG